MLYTIYKTTNKVNGKFYIGSHQTDDLNDGYMGSGKYFKYALEKYGEENFEKEILYFLPNAKEMYVKEKELVTEEYVADKNNYNIMVGGLGGWDHINNDVEFRKEKNKRAAQIANSRGASKKGNDLQKAKWVKAWRDKDPHCKCCGKALPYEKRKNKFCDHSCAAKVNNIGVQRWKGRIK